MMTSMAPQIIVVSDIDIKHICCIFIIYKLIIMKSIEVKDDTVKEILSKEGITVLDFWAPWCGPCRVVGPIIDELASTNEDIQVGKVNIDENGTTAAAYGIRSIPTIIFFKDGEKVHQVSGAQPLASLEKIVREIKG